MSWNEMIKTFKAGEALEAKRIVKIEAGTTNDPPEVVYADAGEMGIGVTEYAVADTEMVAVKLWTAPGTFEIECVIDSAIARGALLYAGANGIVTDTVSGPVIVISMQAAAADNEHIECAPIVINAFSAQGMIQLPMGAWTEQDGTALADFADGASNTPGWHAGDEGFGIRWNNAAAPDPIATSVVLPLDLDPSADVVLHIYAAKVGATLADATTFTAEAFNNVVGALYDADADFGGASSAMTGDAASKTVQELTLTLAAANVVGTPGVLNLTLQPTDGTLGTDDVIVLGCALEYQRKVLTT